MVIYARFVFVVAIALVFAGAMLDNLIVKVLAGLMCVASVYAESFATNPPKERE